MKRSLIAGVALAQLATFLPAQADILYYRFDDAYGAKAVNYAAAPPVPLQGTITSTVPTTWVPGRFGTAFAASTNNASISNSCDTGWVPNHNGSFSFALWLKASATPPTNIWYAFGCNYSFSLRFYSVGTTGTLSTVGFTGTNNVYANTTSTTIYAQSVANWVHVAFVADATALTYTYYVNGVPEAAKPLSQAPSIVYPVALTVGQQLTSSAGSPFDIDEFYFTGRALTAAEVANLASRSLAASAPYDGGCGGLTLGSVGRPTTGNFLYQLTLSSAIPQSFSIGLGSNRASLGGIPLPFDLGTIFGGIGQCVVDSSLDLASLAGSKGPGTTNIGLPIPPNPALDGVTLYLQTLAFGGPTVVQVSNPLALGIGN